MNHQKYKMSFTSGGLLHRESLILTEMYLEEMDWGHVRTQAIEQNVLQAKTLTTLKRIIREAIFRLKTLGTRELNFLLDGTHQEQAYMLWIATCRHYQFIADFSQEVVRERFITLRNVVNSDDLDIFFNQKAEWHPELENISLSSRKKLKQVLFRMLHEAEIIGKDDVINPALITPGLIDALTNGNLKDISLFPIFDADIRGLVS